ncbi:MAG: S8 family serine peptidase, partial [Actinomycetota bacterium]
MEASEQFEEPVGAERPLASLSIETPFWSSQVADSLLETSASIEANPFAVLVRFQPGADGAAVDRLLASIGGRLVGAHEVDADVHIHVVETWVGSDAALAVLRESDLVAVAEPDAVVAAASISADPEVDRQWGLAGSAGIDVVPAWTAASGADDVIVAVVDTGVDGTHPDLDGVMWSNSAEVPGNGIDDDGNGFVDDVNGWDFLDDDNDASDPNGHGTHVAGVIAAEIGNGTGVAGVASNVQIMPLRFLSPEEGRGYVSDAIAAIEYARSHGAEIVNASWGGPALSSALYTALTESSDLLVVAAAGNDGNDVDVLPVYPAAIQSPNVLSVAAHGSNGSRWEHSNHGRTGVDVSAPGVRIVSTADSSYVSMTGTSMATPHAAGVAALVKGIDPSLTPAAIVDIIMDSARWGGGDLADVSQSGGYLDAGRAARAADPAAPNVSIVTQPSSVASGTTVTFTASAGNADDLASQIVWYADSTDDGYDDTRIGEGPTVTVAVANQGRIRLRAEVTDQWGRWNVDTAAFDVVDGVPLAPRAVSATSRFSSLDVSWSAPAADGSSPVTGYTATAQPTGKSCHTTELSCEITGLRNGVGYTVTVVAHNVNGPGAASVPFGPVLAAVVPDAPRSVVAVAGDTRVDVFWGAPTDDGGAPVESYVVRLEPSGAGCETNGRSCAIDGLANGVAQSVTVRAINAVGTGRAGSAAAVTPIAASTTCNGGPTPSSFVDVGSSYAAADVECLRVLGVTTGTSATEYSPNAVVTREQMAAFLSRLYRQITGDACDAGVSSFTDVSASSYAARDVGCLV